MAFTFLLHSYLHSSHQSISIDIYSIILLFWVLFITFLNLDSNFHHLSKILNIYWDFVNFRQILYYIFFTQFTLEVLLHGIWSWKYDLIVISLVWFWIFPDVQYKFVPLSLKLLFDFEFNEESNH